MSNPKKKTTNGYQRLLQGEFFYRGTLSISDFPIRNERNINKHKQNRGSGTQPHTAPRDSLPLTQGRRELVSVAKNRPAAAVYPAKSRETYK